VKRETQSFYEAAVERAVARIARTLDEALDLGALAREAALSPFHFHRIFRGMLGETPLEMHRRLRLERAASELLASRAAITAIAFDAGYETHEAFTRAFRQAYHASPSAFRQAAADPRSGCTRPAQIELAAPSGVHFYRDKTAIQTVRFIAGDSTMDVTIENMPELRVAAIRHVGPYDGMSAAFTRLGAIAGRAGLFGLPNALVLGIYYDDPETTPADQLQSDAGIAIPDGAPLPDGLVENRLPAGRYARMTHVGPYSGLGDAWTRLMGQWLPKSGYRVGDSPAYEVYRNGPDDVPPEKLRTDIYLPSA